MTGGAATGIDSDNASLTLRDVSVYCDSRHENASAIGITCNSGDAVSIWHTDVVVESL